MLDVPRKINLENVLVIKVSMLSDGLMITEGNKNNFQKSMLYLAIILNYYNHPFS